MVLEASLKEEAGRSSGSIFMRRKSCPLLLFTFLHWQNQRLPWELVILSLFLTLGVPSGCQYCNGASHPHLCGVWCLVGHVSSKGAGRQKALGSGKEQRAASLPPWLSAPQRRHLLGRRFYTAPSHWHPPSTTLSHNSTKYTSGPGPPPAGDIQRGTLHMTLVWCNSEPASFYFIVAMKIIEGRKNIHRHIGQCMQYIIT